ncbi:MAG: SMC-Scp complex subunit ScpB [Myxococcales bacterium FL481]|nr:MAG: SMC-Scp complex subunit ScpB [Myxococcales bacterium FL481]
MNDSRSDDDPRPEAAEASEPPNAAEQSVPSIDELVAALGYDKGRTADARGVKLVDSLPIDEADDVRHVEGVASPRLVSIVESLLFAATEPLTVKRLRQVLPESSTRQVQLALKQLIDASAPRGVQVVQVAGGFVLRTNPENATWVQQLIAAKPVRLSKSQVETLALIAYRQPITRVEVDHVRGVDSGAVLKVLADRDLIKIVGRREDAGRPLLYGTTVAFLEFFNLMSLRDLPSLKEFRSLSDDTKVQLKKRMDSDEVEALGQEVLDFAAASASESSGDEARAAAEPVDDEAGQADESPAEVVATGSVTTDDETDDASVAAATTDDHVAPDDDAATPSDEPERASAPADDESAADAEVSAVGDAGAGQDAPAQEPDAPGDSGHDPPAARSDAEDEHKGEDEDEDEDKHE